MKEGLTAVQILSDIEAEVVHELREREGGSIRGIDTESIEKRIGNAVAIACALIMAGRVT